MYVMVVYLLETITVYGKYMFYIYRFLLEM